MAAVPRALRAYVRDAAGAFTQAPLEVLLGVGVAASFSVWVRNDSEKWWWHLATAAALVLPLLFALSALRARGVVGSGLRWAASAAVLLLGGVYGAWVFDPDRSAEGWRFAALAGAAWLALSLAPALRTAPGAERRAGVWAFGFHLLARIVAVVAYGVALFATLAGAVAAVSALFELKTPEHLYQDLWGAVFFGLVPWVVAGGLPALVREPDPESAREGKGMRLLGRYLYFPVLVVYLAILLAYAVKVLATGELPKNVLSPIVLLAGLFGFLGSLFLEPLQRHPEHPAVSRLVRLFPALLLPLLPLAAWALWVRVDEYGWTEPRYLRMGALAALGVLAVLGTARLVRRREPLHVMVPAVLALALLLMAAGPWSATAVSRRAQQARLREALREAGVLRGERVGPLAALPRERRSRFAEGAREVPAALYERITGSIEYLYDAHGPGSLEGTFAGVRRYGGPAGLVEALALRPGCETSPVSWGHAWLPDSAAIPVSGGRLYRFEHATRAGGPEEGGAALQLLLDENGMTLHALRPERWTARVELRSLAARVAARGLRDCDGPRSAEVTLAPEEARFPLVDPAGRRRGELIVSRVAVERRAGAMVLQSASALVVLSE